MRITDIAWLPVAKAAAKGYSKDDVPGLAAEMAYWIIFSIFPFFIFLATLAGLVGRAIGVTNILDNITNNLYGVLDKTTADTLRGVLETILTPGGGALSFGALLSAVLALNSASTAIATMMKAFNRAYGVEETRNFVVAKLTAFGLTLMLVVLLIGGSLLLTAGGALARVFNLGTFGTVLLTVGRLVGALVGITLGLAILYWKGPNVRQTFAFISPGSLLATLGLAIFSALFGLYVSFFAGASFNKTYGAIAGAIIFLFFLRIASTIILIGAEFNAEAARRYDPATIRDKATDPRKQLPGKEGAPHPDAQREAGVTSGQDDPASAPDQDTATESGASTRTAPALDDRLRSIRERPFASARAQVRREAAGEGAPERERRARAALVTLGAATLTAIGAALAGIGRGR